MELRWTAAVADDLELFADYCLKKPPKSRAISTQDL
jgi:hypothetical protein